MKQEMCLFEACLFMYRVYVVLCLILIQNEEISNKLMNLSVYLYIYTLRLFK